MSERRIRTVDFDRLASSTPLNKQAAVDYNATGEQPSCKASGGHVLLAPPRMRPVPTVSTFVDLTGRRFGSLAVIGLKAIEPEDGKWAETRWVCRCTCGNYTLRRADKLSKKPADADERCPECDQKRRVLESAGSKKADRRLRHAIRMAKCREVCGVAAEADEVAEVAAA